jgi:hypothetical protein
LDASAERHVGPSSALGKIAKAARDGKIPMEVHSESFCLDPPALELLDERWQRIDAAIGSERSQNCALIVHNRSDPKGVAAAPSDPWRPHCARWQKGRKLFGRSTNYACQRLNPQPIVDIGTEGVESK